MMSRKKCRVNPGNGREIFVCGSRHDQLARLIGEFGDR